MATAACQFAAAAQHGFIKERRLEAMLLRQGEALTRFSGWGRPRAGQLLLDIAAAFPSLAARLEHTAGLPVKAARLETQPDPR